MIFVVISARGEQENTYDISEEDIESKPEQIQRGREALRLIVGIIVLMLGAQLTVDNATDLARSLGVSELVIGITLVAVGTSLPELVTSVTAAIRKESDIAIGNIVGSNIFNILGILGLTALIQPIAIAEQIVKREIVVVATAVARRRVCRAAPADDRCPGGHRALRCLR